MKTITLPRIPPDADKHCGRYYEWPVKVNWFPGLTETQILENAVAHAYGLPAPHEDPNLIAVRIER